MSECGERINLTSGEFDHFKVFVERSNRVLTRNQIFKFSNTIDIRASELSVNSYVKSLRKKIGLDTKMRNWIKTVYGEGYIFTAAVTKEKGLSDVLQNVSH